MSELLTITEVADSTTIRRWIKLGIFEAIELPTRENAKRHIRRIRKSTVDALLAQATV